MVMVQETTRLVLHQSASPTLLAFVFFSTLCSYNFHWYLGPAQPTEPERTRWTRLHPRLHLFFFVAGACGALYFAFLLRTYWTFLWPAALLTFLYSAPHIDHPVFRGLRKLAVGKTLYLTAIWTYVSTVLPVLIHSSAPDSAYPFFLLSRFTLIFALCLLFDRRDREADRAKGIRSLVTLLPPSAIQRILTGTLLCFVVFTLALLREGWPVPVVLALLLPGLLTAALAGKAQSNPSDYLYYGILDGFMMLSGCITFFLPI